MRKIITRFWRRYGLRVAFILLLGGLLVFLTGSAGRVVWEWRLSQTGEILNGLAERCRGYGVGEWEDYPRRDQAACEELASVEEEFSAMLNEFYPRIEDRLFYTMVIGGIPAFVGGLLLLLEGIGLILSWS